MKRRLLAIALVAGAASVLTGCATGPKFEQVQSSFPQLSPGHGRIYFYRGSTMVGAASAPEIRLNGEPVGIVPVASFFYVDRPAGNYVVTASIVTERRLSLSLAAGETKYVRAYVNLGVIVANVGLELNPPDKGAADLASLTYTGGNAK